MTRIDTIRLLGMFALASCSIAMAEDTLSDDISPQPLNYALNEFASQSGLQLIYRTELVAGIETGGTRSPNTDYEALDQLLTSTGLRYRFINDHTVAIEAAETHAGEPDPGKLPAASGRVTLMAQAQTPPAQTQSGSQRSDDDRYAKIVEEVFVTAQKRVESIQSIPMTVTAFSEDKINALRINGLDDVVSLTPSLGLADFGPDSPNLTMRGIGSTDRDAGSDRSVVVFVDEVYMGRAGGSAFDLFDLERIEVLHGPQGTLYGKNVVGGAIHYITKKPSPETDAYLQVGVGNYNLLETRGMFNTALGNKTTSTAASRTAPVIGTATRRTSGLAMMWTLLIM